MIAPAVSIKVKILSSLLVVFALYVAFASLILDRFLSPAFEQLERAHGEQNARRVTKAIYRELQHLESLVKDWSSWDDSYQFVADQNTQYIASNLVPDTFNSLKLDLIVYCNIHGEIIWKGIHIPHRADAELPELSKKVLPLDDALLAPGVGIYASSQGPMLTAAAPILKSADDGPARGTLIMGRLISGDLLTKLQSDTEVSFTLHEVDRVSGETPSPAEIGDVKVVTANENVVTYTALPFKKAADNIIIKTTSPATITPLGKETTRVIFLTLLAAALLLTFITLLALQKLVINPLANLKNHIQSMHASGDLGARLALRRVDELGELAKEFDDLISKLQNTRETLLQKFAEEKILSQRLSYQANHDALTDLVNRREFLKRLQRVIDTAKRDRSEHALCYLDLDQFKQINDSCGHVAGDELLRRLSQLLKTMVRQRDTLARLGGDEFAILMERCTLTRAAEASNQIREAIDRFRFEWENRELRVAASIGVVPITGDVGGIETILKTVDAACYEAKKQGKNRIHVIKAYTNANQ